MEARVLSIRAVRCVDCGDAERLITVTADAVVSRCYVCGDVAMRRRGPHATGSPRVAASPAGAAG